MIYFNHPDFSADLGIDENAFILLPTINHVDEVVVFQLKII